MTASFDGGKEVFFATSLDQIARLGAARHADGTRDPGMYLGFERAGSYSARTFRPFDIWFEGKYSDIRETDDGVDMHGRFGLLTAGADYVFNPWFLAGVFLQYDHFRQKTDPDDEFSGNGWMAGPYATLRLAPQIFWHARAASGRSSNEVNPTSGGASDTFSTTRWLASTSVVGHYEHGLWALNPYVSISYLEERAEAYIEKSSALEIPKTQTSLGQLRAGPELTYRIERDDGTIMQPRLTAELIWNFSGDISASGLGSIDGEATGPEGARGRVEAGFSSTTATGMAFDVMGSYDGIGAGSYRAMTVRAALRMPMN